MLAKYLNESADLLRHTSTTLDSERMQRAVKLSADALGKNHPILVCGNGGSASDAMHLTGELVGRFLKERRALKVICLSSNPAVLTAWSNDYSYETAFSRQVEAYGEPGSVLLAISTSGNSKNILSALDVARRMDMATIGLSGQGGGQMAPLCDVLLDVPSRNTQLIQQVHVCLYHYYCEALESAITA